MPKKINQRFWEIDALRGIAIIMMVVFHFFFDLNFLNLYKTNLDSGFWLHLARATAIIFLFLVGISLALSRFRAGRYIKQKKDLYIKYLKRGLKIFSWGLIITLITWIFLKQGFVVFGILHLIGISIIIAPLFFYLKYRNLLLGLIILAVGFYLQNFSFDFAYLLWLGFTPKNFYTLDYFPLLPWFGFVLIGLFVGNLLYNGYKRNFKIPNYSENKATKFLGFLGRNSLFIYLIHQPILIFILYIIAVIKS